MGTWSNRNIENPEAYSRAVQNSIFSRATAKRAREWDAAHPELAAWLNHSADAMITLDGGRTYVNNPDAMHKAGPVPTFAREAREKWGSLSQGATTKLQEIYTERMERAAGREAQKAAEAATAQPWTAGRQTVTGEVLSGKIVENDFGSSVKILVKRQDGSKLWTSLPRNIEDQYHQAVSTQSIPNSGLFGWLRGKQITMTVTVQPKAGEPTFAFGSRPTKGSIA